jgi:predicted ATPase/class 3 adenylate cyclase
MPELPTGTITLLFTDIEGSTRRLYKLGERYPEVLAAHRELLRAAFTAHDGREVDTQGDAFFVAFPRATQAVAAAVAAQRALAAYPWPEGGDVRVRMGLHTGEPARTAEGYVGLDLHRGARICDAGHGGQILLSRTTADLAEQDLPDAITLQDLGEHRLKDLVLPEHLFEAVIPGLPSDFPPLRTLDTRPNNLMAPPTPLIGREREVETLRALLHRDDVRLVTLVGPAGMGKTRLGLRMAAELLHDFEHGAFFVALAPISDPGLVASTIAQTLGVREAPNRALLESLKDYLRDRHLLLVLDNFEQVLGAAPLVAELLAACPRLKVLVTSRAALHVYGEHDVTVPPLTLPPRELRDAGRGMKDGSGLVSRLSQYEAVRLFIERAQAARSDFAVTNENAPAVAEICHRVDGLPLAIELAAARVRSLPPQAMLARLEHRLPLLTGGPRDRPARHQTLRAAIAWSHDLLSADEQALFRRLAVFVGGCSLEAAEAVAADEVLDLLDSLVDKNLLREEEQLDGEPRYLMLETVREYALERLEECGEAEDLRRRHAEFFQTLAEEESDKIYGPEQVVWLDRLEREHDNLRAALAWSFEHDAAEVGARLVGGVWLFWYFRGHISEGRRWTEQAVAVTAGRSDVTRARVVLGAGCMAYVQGDYARATALMTECLAYFRVSEDTWRAAQTLYILGWVAHYQGDHRQAVALVEEALELSRSRGHRQVVAYSLGHLAGMLQSYGEHERATALLEEALALSRELGITMVVARSLANLAEIAHAEGQHARAAPLLEESATLFRELGDTGGIGWALFILGQVALAQGDPERAAAHLLESLALRRELGYRGAIAECLERLADVAAARGHPERAARLLGAVAAARGAPSAAPDPFGGMDREAFVAAWAAGRAMSLDQAAAHALSEFQVTGP